MSIADARRVADTVLYEGYLLYPYRASNGKNLTRVRWQFGVLGPRAHHEAEVRPTTAGTVSGAAESWYAATECIVDQCTPDTEIDVMLRFLRVQARTSEDGGAGPLQSGDEGAETELECRLSLEKLRAGEHVVPFELDATCVTEGPLTRRRQALSLQLRASAETLPGPYGITRLRLVVENLTDWARPGAGRDEVLARSTVATHLLVAVSGGRFISLVDPPEWARAAVAGCTNEHTWPVLVGSSAQDMMLSAPMVLPDFPEIAPESPTDLFDGTENDELLSLRIMTLTEEEKAAARATDPRAAAIIDSVDHLPPELYERLHGAIRSLRQVTGEVPEPSLRGTPPSPRGTDDLGELKEPPVPGTEEGVPWWNPAADASVSPETDSVPIKGVEVARGSRVVLRPGVGCSDAQDMFLIGREATVAAVLFDVENEPYVAVTLDDDPGGDIMRWHGRYLYFKPWEVEPLEAGS